MPLSTHSIHSTASNHCSHTSVSIHSVLLIHSLHITTLHAFTLSYNFYTRTFTCPLSFTTPMHNTSSLLNKSINTISFLMDTTYATLTHFLPFQKPLCLRSTSHPVTHSQPYTSSTSQNHCHLTAFLCNRQQRQPLSACHERRPNHLIQPNKNTTIISHGVNQSRPSQ